MEYAIQAQARTVLGKQNSKLRKQGIIPAILYGRGKQSQAIQVSSKQFDKIYRQAGENTLVKTAASHNAKRFINNQRGAPVCGYYQP